MAVGLRRQPRPGLHHHLARSRWLGCQGPRHGPSGWLVRRSAHPRGRGRDLDRRQGTPLSDDPDDVWDAVTRIVGFIDAAGLWVAPALVTDYWDFLALEAEVEAAKADARAAGLLESRIPEARRLS